MVPLSTRVEKYRIIHDKQMQKYGRCLAIVLNNPVPVKYSLHKEISTNMKRLRQLHARGKTVVFPDIDRLEQIMLSELREPDNN